MAEESSELVEHIHAGLRDEVMGHLRVGWAMARLIDSRIYEYEGTLAVWVRRHLPISLRTAQLHCQNWRVIRFLVESDSGALSKDDMLNWVVLSQRAAQALPLPPSNRALVAMAPVLGCEPETIAKVWTQAEAIAQEAGKTQVQAPHVHQATHDVIAPSPNVSRETEDNGEPPEPEETEEQVRHRRALAQLPDDCPTTKLIPEVADAMCDREALRAIGREIQTSRRHLDLLRDNEVAAYLHVDEAKSHLQTAFRMIQQSVAYAPCPYCDQQGRTHGGCKVCVPPGRCKPVGWVPRLRYKMSPGELKKGGAE